MQKRKQNLYVKVILHTVHCKTNIRWLIFFTITNIAVGNIGLMNNKNSSSPNRGKIMSTIVENTRSNPTHYVSK